MRELPINGGTPVPTAPLPSWLHYGAEERRALLEVLDSRRRWATQRTEVREFRRRWGDLHSSGPAVAVANGSHAIDVALPALVIGASRDPTGMQDFANLSRPVTEGLAPTTAREDVLDVVAGVEAMQRHVDEMARSTS